MLQTMMAPNKIKRMIGKIEKVQIHGQGLIAVLEGIRSKLGAELGRDAGGIQTPLAKPSAMETVSNTHIQYFLDIF